VALGMETPWEGVGPTRRVGSWSWPKGGGWQSSVLEVGRLTSIASSSMGRRGGTPEQCQMGDKATCSQTN
jgi:hypothetical protein